MEIIVRFHPSVAEYFNDLVDILFYENYFTFEEGAIHYVTSLIKLVEDQIQIKKHHLTPSLISVRGKYSVSFNINQRTTWYFVFEKSDNLYLITYVFDNYSKEAQYLNL